MDGAKLHLPDWCTVKCIIVNCRVSPLPFSDSFSIPTETLKGNSYSKLWILPYVGNITLKNRFNRPIKILFVARVCVSSILVSCFLWPYLAAFSLKHVSNSSNCAAAVPGCVCLFPLWKWQRCCTSAAVKCETLKIKCQTRKKKYLWGENLLLQFVIGVV